ncbi:response regulator receiver domain [Desulfotignum balticum]|uniref:response regulator receiver domain n=1 Tax=Desulfotignum balticum TaxID=115781 RepID=UPI0003FDF438|nr:response regulator receiver domain [Desulfotignum balticum]
MTESAFFNHSKKIIEDFLSTAIIFDDQAYFGDFNPDPPKDVVSPAKRKTASQKKEDKNTKEIENKGTEDILKPSHDLNAKMVINSFAKKGILCSVIKPEEQELETLHETVASLSQKSDLIIFDWELSQESGKTALGLVKESMKIFNDSSPQQLRLIAIYTGATDINRVFSQIIEELKNEYSVKNVDDRCCQIGACRLLVFSKKAAKTADDVNKIAFEDLADFLIDEYTKMTKGLVSNVVMKSFSAIKQNTHQIINKFSGLDHPFLTHRTCLPKPEEAENQIATLISEEIQSLLEEYGVGNSSNFEVLKLYFQNQPNDKYYSLNKLKKDKCLTKQQVLYLLEHGIPSENENRPPILSTEVLNKKELKKLFQFLTNMYSDSDDENLLDLKYAALTTLKSKYSDNFPYLTLGTIVKDMSGEEGYWICIQPGCDSVRLTKDTSFPFLPLSQKGDIHCVIRDSSESLTRKKISLKFSDCRKSTFSPDPTSKNIIAFKNENDFFFKNTKENVFKFICEMKPGYAQRLSNKFAANISRVATNNSEWLRRCEEKKL